MFGNKAFDCIGNDCQGNDMPFYDPESFHPDVSAGYLIRVCNQFGVGLLDQALAAEEVTTVQWSVLIGIHFANDPTCASLARDMMHDKGAMTRMIDGLEGRGLVVRHRSADDRRIVDLSLTPEGRAVALRCRDIVIARWNTWFDDWSTEEVTGFIAQLQKLRRTMESAALCAA